MDHAMLNCAGKLLFRALSLALIGVKTIGYQ